MRPTRLLRTPTFRLALATIGVFALTSGVLLAFFYASTARFQERRVAEVIEADLRGLIEQYGEQGLLGLRRVIALRGAARPDRASIYLLYDPRGRPLAGNIDRWPDVEPNADGWLEFAVEPRGIDDGTTPHRALARAFLLPDGVRLLVGRDVENVFRFREQVVRAVLWGLGLTLLLALAGGLAVSRQFVGRIEAVNRTTERIMAGDLDRRIERRFEGDEFDRLSGNLNAMLDRIQGLLAERKRVTDDVAHDLRTPLNRLRNRIEVALLGDLDAAAARGLLEDTLADAEGMIVTFNALLDIAQAEAETGAEAIDLAAAVAGAIDLYRPVAEDGGLVLEASLADAPPVRGNRHRLAQATANLLDNAVKYARSRVRVAVRPGVPGAPGGPTLVVEDDGPGVPAAERDRVLQRFVRLGTDRSLPGNGLGLSLVKAVADSHGAVLRLEDAAPGLRAVLAFPSAPADVAVPPPAKRTGREIRRDKEDQASSPAHQDTVGYPQAWG